MRFNADEVTSLTRALWDAEHYLAWTLESHLELRAGPPAALPTPPESVAPSGYWARRWNDAVTQRVWDTVADHWQRLALDAMQAATGIALPPQAWDHACAAIERAVDAMREAVVQEAKATALAHMQAALASEMEHSKGGEGPAVPPHAL